MAARLAIGGDTVFHPELREGSASPQPPAFSITFASMRKPYSRSRTSVPSSRASPYRKKYPWLRAIVGAARRVSWSRASA